MAKATVPVIQSRSRQQGAVLIVGLLMLVVITVLAVSGMNTATTELAIARNDQNYEFAFQAAETGLETALAQSGYDPATTVDLGVNTVGTNENVRTLIDYESKTPVPDQAFSLGGGSGIAAYHFVATSVAESRRAGGGDDTDRDSSAVHTQAFYIIGPEGSAL
jgi:type IV pilus assembly protein PilX